MLKIDAHQHFWNFDPVRDSWINDAMQLIRKDFLPHDLKPILAQHKIDGCIAVQADQSEAETAFLSGLAAAHDFIKGVVGWVDLEAADVEAQLAHYTSFKKLKGFRHVLQGEAQRDFMLRPDFMRGIAALQRHGFTYDLLIYPDQLSFVQQFVARFPDQKFVLDHAAKPYIRDKKISKWKQNLKALALYENVYCKISGLVTEAEWSNWKNEDFTPYLDAVVETFGINRIMFGSDWPVCLVAASYEKVLQLIADYFSAFSLEEQAKFYGSNAIRFYNIAL